LRPYIENALDWWFKHEEWPPQASQLRERAKQQMRSERIERENAATLARYAIPAGDIPVHDMRPIRERIAEWRAKEAAEKEARDAAFETRMQEASSPSTAGSVSMKSPRAAAI
jgi:hypothetical protein